MRKKCNILKKGILLVWVLVFACCVVGCSVQQTQNPQEVQQESQSEDEKDVEDKEDSEDDEKDAEDKEDSEEDEKDAEDKEDSEDDEKDAGDKEDSEEDEKDAEDKEDSEEDEKDAEDKEDSEEDEKDAEDKEDSEEDEKDVKDKEDSEEDEKDVEDKEDSEDVGAASVQMAYPSVSGALQVQGTQLTDSKGNPVQLRGVSTHGLAWYPEYVNQEFFHELHKEWNANVVRLAMYTAESGGYCNDGDKNRLKQLVKDGVQYAANADMYVIIDWHVLRDENPNANIEAAKQFFDEMSKEFSNSNNVLYEICNEPNGGTSWSDVKDYAEEIIPVIRANDEDAIIIVGTPTWCQDVDKAAADPIEGQDNIMYALHFYAMTHTDWLRDRMESAIESGLPIFVTEFGTCDASGGGQIDKTQSDKWIKAMDENGVSYVTWNLSNKDETCAIFKPSCHKTSGFTGDDLSENGVWIYEMLTGEHVQKTEDDSKEDSSKEGSSKENDSSKDSEKQNNENDGDDAVQGTTAHIKYTASVSNSWESNGEFSYQYALTIENTSDEEIENWTVKLTFSDAVTSCNGWNGNYTVEDSVIEITSMDYNGKLGAGDKITDIGFIISGSEELEIVSE